MDFAPSYCILKPNRNGGFKTQIMIDQIKNTMIDNPDIVQDPKVIKMDFTDKITN